MPSVSSKLIQGVFEPNTYSILLTHTTAGLLFWLLKLKSKCSTVLQTVTSCSQTQLSLVLKY